MVPFPSFFLICLLKDQGSLGEGDGVNESDILHRQAVAGDTHTKLLRGKRF